MTQPALADPEVQAEIQKKRASRKVIWRPIQTFPKYEVSNTGLVRSGVSGHILSPHLVNGYKRVTLYLGGKKKHFLVHRLVAQEFIGREDSTHTVVRHLDGNVANNHASNLSWGTQSDNVLDAVKHGTHRSSSKTTCSRGHSLSGKNLQVVSGARRCRECANRRNREYREHRKGTE